MCIRDRSNPECKIIQRVGDIGTHGKPWLRDMIDDLKNEVDCLIFPSNWAFRKITPDENSSQVIFNAPDKIFYENRSTELTRTTPLNIVTHHWSSNPKKGFELYKEFDNYCSKSGEFTFTFIGNLPEGMSISNHIQPLNMEELSKQLPRYDVYITASEEEAGANHVLEAMACGLPIVYLDKGGSIPDYCNKYGTQYKNIKELITILKDIEKSFPDYKSKVLNYTGSIEEVIEKYSGIIRMLCENKYYPKTISPTILKKYTAAQIKRHCKKSDKKRVVEYYKKPANIIAEHLSPDKQAPAKHYFSNHLKKIYSSTNLEMICLGTRNNNERDIFNDLMNKENGILSNIGSLDISPESNANYIMDFNKLPKDWKNRWDIIFSNSIDHCFDGNKCFTEWLRILKPGGLMYIMFDKYSGLPTEEDCCIFEEKDITKIINNNISNITVLNRFDSKHDNHLLVKKNED